MKFKPALFAITLTATLGVALSGCSSDEEAAAPAAAPDASHRGPRPRRPPLPPPPQLKARSFIVLDHDSGRVLAALDPDSRQEPASLTKLMTAYVVFHALKEGRIKLDDLVTVSENAWRQAAPKLGGSAMYIEVGKQISVENLLQGMIVQSGNDATMALAEHVGGTEATFVQMMNNYAKQLGLTGTHFTDSAGHAEPGAVHHGARRGVARERADPRVPRVLPLVLAEGIHLERHHAAEPQRAPVARPVGRRRQDRPHQDRGLLPDRLGEARRHAARVGGDGHGLDARARGREFRAAQLRLQLLRDQARLRGGPAAHEVRVWKGNAARGRPGR